MHRRFRQIAAARNASVLGAILLWLAAAPAAHGADAGSPKASTNAPLLAFVRGDVVAFVGGADVADAMRNGHLEALLAVKHHDLGLRFRNFGWEGDTVFAQPRDIGFPPLREHLRKAGATVVMLQFGRAESLDGRDALPAFVAAYKKLIADCKAITTRLVLVTPPPLERGMGLVPDLSLKNADLEAFASAIRDLAHENGLPAIDVFTALHDRRSAASRLTHNGLQLTGRGQARVAHAFAQQLGFAELAGRAGEPDAAGIWPDAAFEQIRQAVVEKNQFWFHYWRPQNWAFLGGDRTNQPSSRDHRDPKIRWFPAEMEKFLPLIDAKEKQIAGLAQTILAK